MIDFQFERFLERLATTLHQSEHIRGNWKV